MRALASLVASNCEANKESEAADLSACALNLESKWPVAQGFYRRPEEAKD
jgi:hypothetical protein